MSFRDLALEVAEYHETAFARDDKTGAFKTLLVNYGPHPHPHPSPSPSPHS